MKSDNPLRRKTHLLKVTDGKITLIMPLEATTHINRSDSSGVTAGAIAGATATVTAEVLIDYDRASNSATIDQC